MIDSKPLLNVELAIIVSAKSSNILKNQVKKNLRKTKGVFLNEIKGINFKQIDLDIYLFEDIYF